MRKVLSCALLCVAVLAVPAETGAAEAKKVPVRGMGGKVLWITDQSVNWETIRDSIIAVGRNILTYNKPAYETKLTQQERRISKRKLSDKLWDKVCGKDKTLVAGAVLTNKRFGPECVMTKDPELVFVGGIRVGASTSVLEKFFGVPLDQIDMSSAKDEIVWSSAGEDWIESISFLHKNGKITQISWSFVDEYPTSTKTRAFIKRKVKELGLSEDSTFRMRYP